MKTITRITILSLLVVCKLQAQEVTVKGTVKDKSGTLPGVSILIKESTQGTNTDFDGNYSIKAQLGDVLVFSYLGYKTVEKKVKSNKRIDVIMEEDGEELDEIIVTSYGARSRKSSLVIRGMSSISGKAKGVKVVKKSSYDSQSGILTAKEVNDLRNINAWKSLNRIKQYEKIKNDWKLPLGDLLEVNIVNSSNQPVINAMIKLFDDKGIVAIGRSDVFGKATFQKNGSKYYTVQAIHESQIKGLKITSNQDSVVFNFDLENQKIENLDLMFTIDATGSMADEMNYLKSEIEDIINRIDKKIKNKRVALTFYRDHTDLYLVRDFDFSSDIKKVKKNLSKQNAGGGGDYEEAVEIALKKSLNLSWSKDAKSKLLFLLLDAPPHLNQENILEIKAQIRKAKEMGVKLIPIVASGADKNVEYLMRYFGVYTDGSCVFLTDDSGVGYKHIKPKKTGNKVEKLNDLIVRLINKYCGVV